MPRRMNLADRPLRPWAKPGTPLGYARDLAKADQWPPRRRVPTRDPEHPAATAYLVVPFDPSDAGVRPVADARVQYSAGIRVLDAAGAAVHAPVAGGTYTLEAAVADRGVAPAYFGLARFYAAPTADVDAAAAGGPHPTALGHAGFTVNPGALTVVRCPRPWSPQTPGEAAATLLVHAYDPTSDMLAAPFDAHADRHVGRRDPVHDFAGVWDGIITPTFGWLPSYPVRLMITQTGTAISVGYYDHAEGAAAGSPKWTAPGVVSGAEANGLTTELRDGAAGVTNAWSLTLRSPDSLDIELRRASVVPRPRLLIGTGTLTR